MLALHFSIQSIDGAIEGVSGVFMLELFLQAFTGNKAAALGLESLILISALLSIIGMHTWQSRLAWALSRDGGFPFAKQQAKVLRPPFGTPLAAHIWSALWNALLGCLYLASTTAFSSLISASLLFQMISYSIAVSLLNLKGRSKVPHGPFWQGKLGLACNVILVIWTCIAIVFYSLPYFLPVEASQMNYVSATLVIIALYALVFWFLKGRTSYKVPDDTNYPD